MKRLAILLILFSASQSFAFSYETGGCTNGCSTGEQWLASNANEIANAMTDIEGRADDLEAGTTIPAAITRDTEWDTEGEVQTIWGTVNIILETEMDASSELRALVDDEEGTGALLFAGGNVGAATATSPAANDDDTSVATTEYVQDEINALGGTDLTCAAGSCDVDVTVARTANLSAYTVGTSAPVDGSTACTEGDMFLDHTANKIYFCVDSATDDWFGVGLTDTP